jgi:putative aminopeptidase FrvX
MNQASSDKNHLYKMLSLASPTGGEQVLQRYLHEWAKPFADRIEADLMGNMALVINPKARLRVMLSAHCDRIGFLIMEITEQGYLRVDSLGGIDEATVYGARAVIRGKKGDVPGIFGKISTHLQTKKQKEQVPLMDEVWIDIGAKNKEEAQELVSVGDYAVYEPSVTELKGSRFAAPALDNIIGVYSVMQVAKNCAERGINVALYCLGTVQEEIGARGATAAAEGIRPDIAIAVDTTLATDTPGKTKNLTDPALGLDKGPSILRGPNGHPVITRLLVEVAQKNNLPYQIKPDAKAASNDAKPLQLAAGGTAASSIGIPLRNMHTQNEVASMADIEATIRLLTEFVCSLKEDQDLLPINFDKKGKPLPKLVETPGFRQR